MIVFCSKLYFQVKKTNPELRYHERFCLLVFSVFCLTPCLFTVNFDFLQLSLPKYVFFFFSHVRVFFSFPPPWPAVRAGAACLRALSVLISVTRPAAHTPRRSAWCLVTPQSQESLLLAAQLLNCSTPCCL